MDYVHLGGSLLLPPKVADISLRLGVDYSGHLCADCAHREVRNEPAGVLGTAHTVGRQRCGESIQRALGDCAHRGAWTVTNVGVGNIVNVGSGLYSPGGWHCGHLCGGKSVQRGCGDCIHRDVVSVYM